MSHRLGRGPGARRPSAASLVIGVLVLGLSALVIWYGVEGALASAGLAGTPGKLAITTCFHGRSPSCVGTFTPDDPSAAAIQTAGIPGTYNRGTTVRVQLLYGEAWPTQESRPPAWLAFVILGIGIGITYALVVVARAYWAGDDPQPPPARRRRRRRALSRSGLRRRRHEHPTGGVFELTVDPASPSRTEREH